MSLPKFDKTSQKENPAPAGLFLLYNQKFLTYVYKKNFFRGNQGFSPGNKNFRR